LVLVVARRGSFGRVATGLVFFRLGALDFGVLVLLRLLLVGFLVVFFLAPAFLFLVDNRALAPEEEEEEEEEVQRCADLQSSASKLQSLAK
jgi:hypothetical protein